MNEITTYSVPKEIEKKILTAIELKKELDQYEKDIKTALKEAMEAHDIYSIRNDVFTATLATRKTYKAVGEIPEEFSKPGLDSSKVGKFVDLYGDTPDGIEQSVTKYVTWRAK